MADGIGFQGVPVWGHANHVLVLRGTGLVRPGPSPVLRSVGGVGIADQLTAGTDFGAASPVRGFDSGTRRGTRAWSATTEWRFPLYLRDVPHRLLGFSLTALSGTLFADAGDAWCPAGSLRPELLALCSAPADVPLASAGFELNVDFGIYHDSGVRLVAGIAQPLQGPGSKPVLYLGTGF